MLQRSPTADELRRARKLAARPSQSKGFVVKFRNGILTCLLASLTALAGLVSVVASAQTEDAPAVVKGKETLATFVVYRNAAGEVTCREATPAERQRIMDARPGDGLHVIYKGAPRTRTAAGIVEEYPTGNDYSSGDDTSSTSAATTGSTLAALQPSAGLHIFLHGTAQLEANQDAKNAFIVAANRWEALISTPINVVIDVDYGTTFFGTPYGDPNILGQTGSRDLASSYSTVRQKLIAKSPSAAEAQLYNALPATAVPVELNSTTTSTSTIVMTRANARALDLAANISSDATVTDAQIGFNSAFGFDFNPDDGIATGKTDFDSVVTHEIGHALGFISESGGGSTSDMSIWDMFRFRPGTVSTSNLGAVTTAARVMSAGGTQVFFDNQASTVQATLGVQELGLSTGGPKGDASGGDGRQSSHWKDDGILVGGVRGPYIGIMDPTIASGVRRALTDNDVKAIDSFGYVVGGTVVIPPAPLNDNFINATTILGGVGGANGTNESGTKEPGEPNHAQNEGGASVWYNWTAPSTGTATFDTTGSSYDTTLAAYTGSSVNALTLLAENDDIVLGQNVQSHITFPTVAGVTYRIAVDGFDGSTGTITLNWIATGTTPTPTPTPTPASYTLTGRVVDPDGSPLVNVRVSLDGPNLTNSFPALPTFTNADGYYQWTLLRGGGNYTVRPDDPRYTFNPVTAVFNGISSDKTGVNFTATSAPASITGTVSEGGKPLPGVAVGLYGFSPLRLLKQTTTDANGRWTFNGMTVGQGYNAVFLKSGYAFTPPSLIFPLNTTATDMGDVPATKTNAIEASDFFATQQYRDFLGREPDAAGLSFWTNEIEQCGFDTQCRQIKRINVSAAFFLSIEFQQTGYLVERMYKVAYGDVTEVSTGLVVPVIRRQEFLDDTPVIRNNVIVGQGDWAAQLEANKNTYAAAFVQRQRFTNAYPSTMTPAEFVDKLNANAGGVLDATERANLVGELTGNNTSAGRASVLRKVAEDADLDSREKNRAFVLMQYYGYLQRNPDDAPEANRNFAGWNFWLAKLIQFNGDFVRAEMVKAFLDSTEYRNRFSN
jgi:hypothetical protein